MTSFATPIGTGLKEASFLIVPDAGRDIYDIINEAKLAGYRRIIVHPDNTATVVLIEEESADA